MTRWEGEAGTTRRTQFSQRLREQNRPRKYDISQYMIYHNIWHGSMMLLGVNNNNNDFI